jgi:hypothetical protein
MVANYKSLHHVKIISLIISLIIIIALFTNRIHEDDTKTSAIKFNEIQQNMSGYSINFKPITYDNFDAYNKMRYKDEYIDKMLRQLNIGVKHSRKPIYIKESTLTKCIGFKVSFRGGETLSYSILSLLYIIFRMSMIYEHFDMIVIHTTSEFIRNWSIVYGFELDFDKCDILMRNDADDPIIFDNIRLIDKYNVSFCNPSITVVRLSELYSKFHTMDLGYCPSIGMVLMKTDIRKYYSVNHFMVKDIKKVNDYHPLYNINFKSSFYRSNVFSDKTHEFSNYKDYGQIEQLIMLQMIDSMFNPMILMSNKKCHRSPWKVLFSIIYSHHAGCECTSYDCQNLLSCALECYKNTAFYIEDPSINPDFDLGRDT